MREGIRRLAVAIKALSWVWFAIVVAYFTWEWLTHDYEYETPLVLRLQILIPAFLGFGLAWIVDGFAKPDPPPPSGEDEEDDGERESFFGFVTRRDRDP